jgi:sulfoxide reductase heme-binding subunit YedZ
VTALGETALEAETLSKMALLLGPDGARQVLGDQGGVIVHDDGEVEAIGPIDGGSTWPRPSGRSGEGADGADPVPVVAGQPRIGDPGAGADLAVGVDGARDGHQSAFPPGAQARRRASAHVALVAIAAIAVHGLALLGDSWLKPGWRDITVPFAIAYRPQFTGLGIIAGYSAVLLGPSFYVRRRIGARRWRKLHRATPVVWLLVVIHTLGAGSDGGKLWLRCVVLAPVIPIVYLLVLRMLQGGGRAGRTQRPAEARNAAIHHAGRSHEGVPRTERHPVAPRHLAKETP